MSQVDAVLKNLAKKSPADLMLKRAAVAFQKRKRSAKSSGAHPVDYTTSSSEDEMDLFNEPTPTPGAAKKQKVSNKPPTTTKAVATKSSSTKTKAKAKAKSNENQNIPAAQQSKPKPIAKKNSSGKKTASLKPKKSVSPAKKSTSSKSVPKLLPKPVDTIPSDSEMSMDDAPIIQRLSKIGSTQTIDKPSSPKPSPPKPSPPNPKKKTFDLQPNIDIPLKTVQPVADEDDGFDTAAEDDVPVETPIEDTMETQDDNEETRRLEGELAEMQRRNESLFNAFEQYRSLRETDPEKLLQEFKQHVEQRQRSSDNLIQEQEKELKSLRRKLKERRSPEIKEVVREVQVEVVKEVVRRDPKDVERIQELEHKLNQVETKLQQLQKEKEKVKEVPPPTRYVSTLEHMVKLYEEMTGCNISSVEEGSRRGAREDEQVSEDEKKVLTYKCRQSGGQNHTLTFSLLVPTTSEKKYTYIPNDTTHLTDLPNPLQTEIEFDEDMRRMFWKKLSDWGVGVGVGKDERDVEEQGGVGEQGDDARDGDQVEQTGETVENAEMNVTNAMEVDVTNQVDDSVDAYVDISNLVEESVQEQA